MERDALVQIGLTYKGTELRYPFDPDMPVLYVCGKIFAIFHRRNNAESVNLKTNPDENWLQRETYPRAVQPGWHMNKQHWNTVLLDDIVPDSAITDMLEESYLLVASKLSKSKREFLGLYKPKN